MEPNLKYFSNKRILITGGGGYLGSKLAEKIAGSSAELYLLDLRFNELSERLISERKNTLKLECDLTDSNDVNEACKEANPELIFHFGAILDRDRDFLIFDKLYKVNVIGTFNLLNALKPNEYFNFIYSSSSEVYGTINNAPFREDMLPFPASPYSLSKLMAEQLISTFSQINAKPFTILRLFNFYGSGMPESFFLSQLEAKLIRNENFQMTGGMQKRDYLKISDLVDLIFMIAKCEKCIGETINLCSGRGTTLKDIAIQIAGAYRKTHLLDIGVLPYRVNEVWDMTGDNSKLKAILKLEDDNLGGYDEV